MVRVIAKIVVSFAFQIGQSEYPIVRLQLAWSPGSRYVWASVAKAESDATELKSNNDRQA
jgi:hypothetical protein